MDRQLTILFALTFLINLVGSLAYSVRIAGVRTGRIALSFSLNGKTHDLAVAPNVVLADLLRDRIALNGCKVAFDEGVCGACTVIVDGKPTAACVTFAFAVDGCSITTIEGLGHHDALHRVQTAFLATGAF